MDKILNLLENDATLNAKQLSVMLDKEVGDIKASIEKYEKDGVILGYKTIIDWDKTDREYVTALIEVKLTPQKDRGFDKVAEKIYNYDEVKSLYLMSGAYDLAVFIEGGLDLDLRPQRDEHRRQDQNEIIDVKTVVIRTVSGHKMPPFIDNSIPCRRRLFNKRGELQAERRCDILTIGL